MLSKALLDMVKETFTKYGEFVPSAHLTSVVSVCSSLVSDPNQAAYAQIDDVAFHFSVISHISSHWTSQAKFSESTMKTVTAKVSGEVRKQAALNKEKLTVDAISTLVATDSRVVQAQYSADVALELSLVSKSLAKSVIMQHESLIERTRSERAEVKINR